MRSALRSKWWLVGFAPRARTRLFCVSLAWLSIAWLAGCKREAVSPKAESAPAQEVEAAWYDVPPASLAQRRAGPNEFTAAHNKFPLGTLVRVTRLTNGKSVVVRITDRGIHDRQVQLDLCRPAAEELEMVRDGVARVRLEIVPEPSATSSK